MKIKTPTAVRFGGAWLPMSEPLGVCHPLFDRLPAATRGLAGGGPLS